MTDDQSRRPFEGIDEMDDRAPAGMPAHEQDPDATVGGGMMGSGGTSVDRGTGELGADGSRDLSEEALDDDTVVSAGPPAGGAQSYVPALHDDDEDGGTIPDA